MFVEEASQNPSAGAERTAASAPRGPSGAPELVQAEPAQRASIEAFIARRFDEVYGARVHSFMPRLLGLHDHGGALIAALGLRAADREKLFLEHYLDAPVELMVERQFGQRARRGEIAEVGNLAGATPGALRQLIPALTTLLHREGFHWVAFTGAAHLCNAFSRLGLPLAVVAPARLDRLPQSERQCWGRYYDRHPSVMLGDVAEGFHSLIEESSGRRALQARLAPLARVGAP